jgi:phosphoribosylformylglycinamidine synthase
MKARVHIMPKPGVLDPQGRAIGRALAALGFTEIAEVRQGKVIDLDLAETDAARARDAIDAMCRQLLANTVVESYRIELET